MAEKKRTPDRNRDASKPRTSARKRAPGKPDPKFLPRLSRAIEEEYKHASGTTSAPSPLEPQSENERDAPSESIPVQQTSETRKAPKGRKKPNPEKAPTKRRDKLLKEFYPLLEELDEEGIEFLLEQAHIHRYNMEVERLNEAEDRLAKSSASKKKTSGRGMGKSAAHPVPLRIERSQDGNTYHIVSKGQYKMFSAEEMLALVRIAHADSSSSEAVRGLYRWLARERSDALTDLDISGPSDPNLAALAKLLKESFSKPARRRP